MGQMRARDARGRFITDGLANLASGAGTSVDKRMHGFWTQPYILPEQIEAAYRTSWLMKKLCDLPPFDMTRERRDWQAEEADVDKIEAEEKRLGVWGKLNEALTLARLGGGAIIMGLASDATQPITDADKREGGLRYLHVMNRWQLPAGPMVRDTSDPLFGQPQYFQMPLGTGAKASPLNIHPSRVIAFRGRRVPNLSRTIGDEWFWGDAEMASVSDAVKNADMAMNGFASLIEEAKLDTVSIPGLTRMLATAEGEALVQKRVTVANQLKSSHNTRILDGGNGKDSPGEEWDTRQVTWAGMPDMMKAYLSFVAGAADIPATRLLGKSPDGMNSTGDSDMANYIMMIRAKQENELRPALDQLDALLLPSAGVTTTADVNYDFPPLAEMGELDKATAFNTRMQGINTLASLNVIPQIALEKSIQHTAVEEGWLAGLDGALAEVPDDERFPSESAPEVGPDGQPVDPSALQAPDTVNAAKGGGQVSPTAAGSSPGARRRAANDALKAVGLSDAAIDDIMAMIEVESTED